VHARLGFLAAIAVMATGCGSHHPAKPARAASAAPLIPWSDAPVQELAAPSGTPAPPCRASQLRAQRDGFTFQASISGATGAVRLRNVGTAACRLTGRPAVRFVGAPKAPAQRQVAEPAQPPAFPQVLRPAETLLSLPPGESASLAIDWRNWCVPNATRATKPLIPPKAVRITLPGGGGSLNVPYSAVTSCQAPNDPSTIGVRPFQPTALPTRRPWTDQVLSARVLTLDGRAATLHAKRGQVLRYSVALRNEGRAAVRFDNCPFGVQMLAPAGRPEAHTLDCAAAHPLAPRASLRFELRIRIPPNAPLGANGLFWELDPLGAQGPQVVSRVIVGR
jgi:hypothetical protein